MRTPARVIFQRSVSNTTYRVVRRARDYSSRDDAFVIETESKDALDQSVWSNVGQVCVTAHEESHHLRVLHALLKERGNELDRAEGAAVAVEFTR